MNDTTTAAPTRTPLYGYTSPETAYLVADYPYGRKVRCRIRYWLETDPKKGARFVSQTEHPTRLVWNAPKKSVYALLAGCMYLDESGHVQWATLNEYSKPAEALAFVQAFPGADLARVTAWALQKRAYKRMVLDGKAVWHVNGVAKPYTESELAEHAAELAEWDAVSAALKPAGTP